MTYLATAESPILEEYQKAKKEGRQPNCPFCNRPLELSQTQYTDIHWTWNTEEKRYIKDDSSGDAEKPYCVHCDTKDWDFIDFDLVDF